MRNETLGESSMKFASEMLDIIYKKPLMSPRLPMDEFLTISKLQFSI